MADFAGLRITRWAGQHEVSQSRKVTGALSWVAVPTKQGRGYCRLIAKCGAEGLGVWVAILEQAASRTIGNRGVIMGDLDDVAMLTRLPADTIGRVLPVLYQIGWLEPIDGHERSNNAPATSVLPAGSDQSGSVLSTQTDGTDGRTERPDGPDGAAADASPLPSGSGGSAQPTCSNCNQTTPVVTPTGGLCFACSQRETA